MFYSYFIIRRKKNIFDHITKRKYKKRNKQGNDNKRLRISLIDDAFLKFIKTDDKCKI